MKTTTVRIDLAKNVFALHGVNVHGRTVLNKVLKRNHVAEFFANLPACVIGWRPARARTIGPASMQAMGHTVRLIALQFVKPYVKTNKNDAADAEAVNAD